MMGQLLGFHPQWTLGLGYLFCQGNANCRCRHCCWRCACCPWCPLVPPALLTLPLLLLLLVQESVALVLKQPALIGLDTAELTARIQGLSQAVGCDAAAAAKLAGSHAALIMLHPDYVKVSQRAHAAHNFWLWCVARCRSRCCVVLTACLVIMGCCCCDMPAALTRVPLTSALTAPAP
jgi:hypothetical protein